MKGCLFMSVDNSLNTALQMPYSVCLAQTLSDSEKRHIASLLRLLPDSLLSINSNNDMQLNIDNTKNISTITIKSMVDGRGLACPMPLLKTKVALRDLISGDSLYVIATDPNSRADIAAFCQQTQQANHAAPLLLIVNQATRQSSVTDLTTADADTIFHFIITKTDSN